MITLCVPTKDRPDFLERLLRYYARVRWSHWIFIGDSSERAQAERNQQTVASYQGDLKLLYRVYPGHSSCAALEQLSHLVETSYCALVCDDDILCPTGIERCIAFLADHPECSAAHGIGLFLQVEGEQPYGPIGTVRPYPQAVLSADTGSARLRELFTESTAALLYSVHRTETWQAMFQGLSDLPGVQNRNVFKDELIATCTSVVRGKVQQLDTLYLVRQMHQGMHRHPHVYDWITDPGWYASYEVFRDRLVSELMRQDGLTEAQAHAAVREGFWPYLASCVMSAWRKDNAGRAPRRPSRLRPYAKRIPGARRSWRWMRARLLRWRDALSLPALLDPRSPYHEDFMPLYDVITSRFVPPTAPQGQLETRPEAVVAAGEESTTWHS